jgi:hypothetical protein
MPECAHCKAETGLHVDGVPVCVRCADKSPKRRDLKATLLLDLKNAILRAVEANTAFLSTINDVLPGADGTQQVHNASHQLTTARDQMMNAHRRLNDYVEHGIVPDDLKRGNG